ncbi:RNA-binding protein [Plasmodium brasilianum]|uniref:RNA-binding protein, putative n=2 Tax=Plasmodium (Plasmodium) TaxID=418103 RepID=A0A1A8VUB3_PLAMA|nr:RNA-binding protein, putative [Plasmodium malariae]KAI4837881.1 RNA-binding protein [Plasmodium brasilianum]SBS83270.1 RNA-binding protein, putative [Plasmodium malariae]SCN45011.1 RNA-binding protein, putative [Plasmodium malariae]
MFLRLFKERKYINRPSIICNTRITVTYPFMNDVRFLKTCHSEYHNIQELKINLPRLKLRGLPFDVSQEEIKTFFKNFKLSNEEHSIHIIKGLGNKPTGHAYVYFDDEEEARNACQALNRKFLRNRYIEIYIDYVFNHNITPVKEHVTTLMRDRYRKDNQ